MPDPALDARTRALPVYLAQRRDVLDHLQQAITDGNHQEVSYLAHNLAGAARMMGEHALADALVALEKWGSGRAAPGQVQVLWDELKVACTAAVTEGPLAGIPPESRATNAV